MLLRLAVLGTLGYLGYRQLQKMQPDTASQTSFRPRELSLAGGPLSDQARTQSDPDVAPSASTVTDKTTV